MPGIIKSSLGNEQLKGFLQNYHITFSNALLILFTIGGEEIFKSTAFDCPCTQPMATRYASALLFIPPVILALVGVMASNLTWRLFHGYRSRDEKSANGRYNTCKQFGIVLSRAFIVPLAWVFITGLDGSYYACMLSDKAINCKPETALNETEKWSHETEKKNYTRIKKTAQMYSWIALLLLIAVATIIICIVRCQASVTTEHFQFINDYRKAEETAFDTAQKEYANNLAKKVVKVFMDSQPQEKKDWDYISRIPDILDNDEWEKFKAAKQNQQKTAAKPDEQDTGAKLDKAAKPDEKNKTDKPIKLATCKFFTHLHKWASEHEKTKEASKGEETVKASEPAGAGTSTTEVKTPSDLSATGVQNIVRPRPKPPQHRNETPIPLFSTSNWGTTEKNFKAVKGGSNK